MEQCADCEQYYTERGITLHHYACKKRRQRLQREAMVEGKKKLLAKQIASSKVDAYYILSSAGVSDSVIDKEYGLMLLD